MPKVTLTDLSRLGKASKSIGRKVDTVTIDRGVHLVSMPEEYEASEITAHDMDNDHQLRLVDPLTRMVDVTAPDGSTGRLVDMACRGHGQELLVWWENGHRSWCDREGCVLETRRERESW